MARLIKPVGVLVAAVLFIAIFGVASCGAQNNNASGNNGKEGLTLNPSCQHAFTGYTKNTTIVGLVAKSHLKLESEGLKRIYGKLTFTYGQCYASDSIGAQTGGSVITIYVNKGGANSNSDLRTVRNYLSSTGKFYRITG